MRCASTPGITPEIFEEVRSLIGAHVAAGAASQMLGSLGTTDRPGFVVRCLGNRTGDLFSLILAIADRAASVLAAETAAFACRRLVAGGRWLVAGG